MRRTSRSRAATSGAHDVTGVPGIGRLARPKKLICVDSDLTAADVLSGAGYLGLALRRLYDRSDAELLAQITAVNKRRGPVRKRQN